MARIWVFHHYAEPPDGQFTASYELAQQLVNRGHRVTMFVSSFSHYNLAEERLRWHQLSVSQLFGGVEFVFVRTIPYRRNDWRRALNMIAYAPVALVAAVRRRDQPDVVIGSTPHPFAALTGYAVSRLTGSRFVFEVYDLWPQFLVELGVLPERSVITAILRWCESYCFRKAEKIVTLWPGMSQYVAERGISADKVVWIPLGIDPANYAPVVQRHCVGDGGFTVMYRGGFGLSNDVGLILEAASLLQRRGFDWIRFIIAGRGTGKADLVARSRELGLGNVEFRDFVPREQLARELAEAHAFVCTLPDLPHFKKYGQIQTKLLDYLAAGRPTVLATNVTPNLVNEAGAGIVVPPGDACALADGLIQLVSVGLDERAEMGKNGRRYVAAHHDIKQLAARLEAVVITTLNGS